MAGRDYKFEVKTNFPRNKVGVYNTPSSGMKIRPLRLDELVEVLGGDFEFIINRMPTPRATSTARNSTQAIEWISLMTQDQATTMALAIEHILDGGHIEIVDSRTELADMDTLEAELERIDG